MDNKPISSAADVVVAPDSAQLPAAVIPPAKSKSVPKPKSPPVKAAPTKKTPPPPPKKNPSTIAKAAQVDKVITSGQKPVHQNLVGVHTIEYQVVSKFNLQDLCYEVANLLNEQIPWQLSGGVTFAERPGAWVQTLIRHKM